MPRPALSRVGSVLTARRSGRRASRRVQRRCSAITSLRRIAPTPSSALIVASRYMPAIRMVNSKRIQFNFKVEDVGPAGVAAVEMWCTVDGRNWQKCTNVQVVGGMCVTEVAEEGTYGFTLVARNAT